MLVNWTQPKHVFIVCGKTDLRKGIDGLAAVVAENYDLDLFDDSLFLFCGTRNDRFKGLYWDGEGFILLYKRFEMCDGYRGYGQEQLPKATFGSCLIHIRRPFIELVKAFKLKEDA